MVLIKQDIYKSSGGGALLILVLRLSPFSFSLFAPQHTSYTTDCESPATAGDLQSQDISRDEFSPP